MKAGTVIIIFCITIASVFAACTKNYVSNVPNVTLTAYPTLLKADKDTMYILFNVVDGDADIGNDDTGVSAIYYKDTRDDSAEFTKVPFPDIKPDYEDPKKGVQIACTLYVDPQPGLRPDTTHQKYGDTLKYELYVKDRAGHISNHAVSGPIIVRP